MAALVAGVTASAQSSIQFFTVQKIQGFTQTGAGGANVSANAYNPGTDTYPWRFAANIQGTSLDNTHPAPPNHVVSAAGSAVTAFDLSFAPVFGWEYRPGYSSRAAMDADYNNGSYTVTLANGGATPFALNLAGTIYPNNPVAALTGGSWAGGVYVLNPANAWTISTGTFATGFGWDVSRVELAIAGPGVDFQQNIGVGTASPFVLTDTSASLSLASGDVGAPTFLAGETYSVSIRFLTGSDFQDIGLALGQTAGSAYAAAIYDSYLSLTIQAVPEPATTGALAGLLALGLAAWRRRRLA
ncbi:MAG: PEP-CTERM sorting domain-containing protein [Opitutae bacterium]|nr:PEP-CTERM sorting domain-containing protein [Opitutae bacterium]